MAAAVGADPVMSGCDVVVPVPLHPHRLVVRGFNQSELLAGEVASGLGLPLDVRVLRRIRDTPAQVGLPKAGRRANVQAAFEAVPSAAKRVLLVDDVVSTGSTAAACAKSLRAAGAHQVAVLTLARTVLD